MGKKIKFKDKFIKITLLTTNLLHVFRTHCLCVYVIVQCDGGSMEYSDLNYTICYHVIFFKKFKSDSLKEMRRNLYEQVTQSAVFQHRTLYNCTAVNR